jgi:hypothetical protein
MIAATIRELCITGNARQAFIFATAMTSCGMTHAYLSYCYSFRNSSNLLRALPEQFNRAQCWNDY